VATASPLTTLDEVVTAVRRLLRGDEVTVAGREVSLDQVRLEHVPDPTPPVLAGVTGPKSLALAGRVADGVVLAGPNTVPFAAAARESASGGPDFQVVAFTTIAVTGERAEAHRILAPWVAEMLPSPGFRALPFLDEMRALHDRDGLDGLVGMPRDWWLQIGAIGTLDDALEHVALLETEGVASVAFLPAPDIEIGRYQIDDVVAVAAGG
jgi:alkanesulfonate monooxygenase SsuD/methylene tetrahydromethanopterin reductase-like flavin-dependent oxidoreductase (luciferase family)